MLRYLRKHLFNQGNKQVSVLYKRRVHCEKKINDYNYYIYDNGDVLNIATNKILKGSIGEYGYKYYRLSKDNNKKMFYGYVI